MKFIIIFGPPAVGKMTVGQALEKLTGFKMFHNHQTIDLVKQYFPYGSPPFNRLVGSFRKQLIEEAAANEVNLIFTYVWALDDEDDKLYVDELRALVERHGGETYYVELEASLDARLYRNTTENRINHKPHSKANIVDSERNLRSLEEQYRMNSSGEFFYTNNFLKIINTALSAEAAAERIVDAFHFPRLEPSPLTHTRKEPE